jgi:hypothetical protein
MDSPWGISKQGQLMESNGWRYVEGGPGVGWTRAINTPISTKYQGGGKGS